jgi:predicted Zn-dependent protease
LALAKLLIEVESFERAMAILETCQAENDLDCEIWYLFAWCYSSLAKISDDKEDVESLNQDAKECLEKIVSLDERFRNTGEGVVPEDILEHAIEMMNDIDSGDIEMVK